jgi:hypothetical protein
MAHLWELDREGRWSARPLGAFPTMLAADLRDLMHTVWFAQRDDRPDYAVSVVRADAAAGPAWVLTAGAKADVQVNGRRMAGRLRVLTDGDDIWIGAFWQGSQRFVFAADSPPFVVTYYGADFMTDAGEQPPCARCGRRIGMGTPAVECPTCHAWHHESPDARCWTRSTTCSSCQQATDLSAPFRWRPGGGVARR